MTGYTHNVLKDISFKGFLKECAGAFDYKEDSEGKVKPYKNPLLNNYKDSYKKACRDLKYYTDMSIAKATKLRDKEFEKSKKEYDTYRGRLEKDNKKLEAMKEQVLLWEVSNKDYSELKKFMIRQIDNSIQDFSVYEYGMKKQSVENWLQSKIDDSAKDVRYYTKLIKKEEAEEKETNKWLKTLNKSINKLK